MSQKNAYRIRKEKRLQEGRVERTPHSAALHAKKKHDEIMKGRQVILVPHPTVPKT